MMASHVCLIIMTKHSCLCYITLYLKNKNMYRDSVTPVCE